MNRLTFAVVAATLAAVSQLADAQPCDAKTKPTACFVDSALTSLDSCQTASHSGTGGFACIAEGETRIEPLYEEAIYASERNGHTALLKDFHASWQVAMNGVRPSASERPAAYKARQSANKNALDAKAEQLKVD
jgi:hypothetical protein